MRIGKSYEDSKTKDVIDGRGKRSQSIQAGKPEMAVLLQLRRLRGSDRRISLTCAIHG
jgi:hypothetical protein